MKNNLSIFKGILLSATLILTTISVKANHQQDISEKDKYLGARTYFSHKPVNPKIPPAPGFNPNKTKSFIRPTQDFHNKMLQKFDANHDGHIDTTERNLMRQARRQHRQLSKQ